MFTPTPPAPSSTTTIGPSSQHVKNGYDINGYSFGTKVSFRPPFYTCQTCQPEYVSDTFRKSSSYWYDDDYISQYGLRRQYDDDANGNGGDDDGDNNGDEMPMVMMIRYFQYGDDAYDPNYVGDDDYYHQDDVRFLFWHSLLHSSWDHTFCILLVLVLCFGSVCLPAFLFSNNSINAPR